MDFPGRSWTSLAAKKSVASAAARRRSAAVMGTTMVATYAGGTSAERAAAGVVAVLVVVVVVVGRRKGQCLGSAQRTHPHCHSGTETQTGKHLFTHLHFAHSKAHMMRTVFLSVLGS